METPTRQEFSPSNILARLDELKRWQNEQQERLKQRQEQQRELLTNEQRRMCQAFDLTLRSDESTILNLLPPENFTNPTLEQPDAIIANKESSILDADAVRTNTPEIVDENQNKAVVEIRHSFSGVPKIDAQMENSKPKFSYLKKGEGLKRYKQSAEDILRKRKNRVQVNAERRCQGNLEWKEKAAPLGGNVITEERYKELLTGLKMQRDVNELQVFEYLEKNADEVEINKAVELLKVDQSTPRLEKFLKKTLQEPKVRFEGMSSDEETVDYEEIVNVPTNVRNDFEDQNQWNDTESEVEEIMDKTEESVEEIAELDNHDDIVFKSDLLKKRLGELETEIATFRNENASLIKQRQQLAAEKRKFLKEKVDKEKELADEKRRLDVWIEDERKKLSKEKMVFEKYVKDLKNQPTRKEREEISTLKNEVKTLKEEIKVKDTKHGAFVARLRTQIRQMGKELANVKVENEKLVKENKRLGSSQKRQGSNTKVLHEINKNLTKILPKALAEQRLKEIMNEKSESSDNDSDEENNQNPINHCHNNKSSYFSSPRSEEPQSESILQNDKLINENRNSVQVLRDVIYPEVTYRKPIEETYKKTFENDKEIINLPNGVVETHYPNGNIKTVLVDGTVKLKYFNGDLKETSTNGTVKYFYAKTKTTHVTYPDGFEVLEFPNGQVEQRFKNGKVEIQFPNGYKKVIDTDRTESWLYSDGTRVVNKPDGEKVIELPNGQKEIHNNQHKRREYPDGTVKILYPDSTTETRYANGRIRIKDKNGRLLMDSGEK